MNIQSHEKALLPADCKNCSVQQRNYEISMTHYEQMYTDFDSIKDQLREQIPGCCDRLIAYFQMRKEDIMQGLIDLAPKHHAADSSHSVLDIYNTVLDTYEIPPSSVFMKETANKIDKDIHVFKEPPIVILNEKPPCSIGFHELIQGLYKRRIWTDPIQSYGWMHCEQVSCRTIVTYKPGLITGPNLGSEMERSKIKLNENKANYYESLAKRTAEENRMTREAFEHQKEKEERNL